MLYNRSLLGRLTIFSLSTLRHNNFFLLDLNNNSVKYRTALSLQGGPRSRAIRFRSLRFRAVQRNAVPRNAYPLRSIPRSSLQATL